MIGSPMFHLLVWITKAKKMLSNSLISILRHTALSSLRMGYLALQRQAKERLRRRRWMLRNSLTLQMLARCVYAEGVYLFYCLLIIFNSKRQGRQRKGEGLLKRGLSPSPTPESFLCLFPFRHPALPPADFRRPTFQQIFQVATLIFIIMATCPLLRKPQPSNPQQPNVFERLTIKKSLMPTDMTKSSIHTKPKPPPSPHPTHRSAIAPQTFQKRPEKAVEKVSLTPSDYHYVMFPVFYAEHEVVLVLESQQPNNFCKLKMNYSHYDVVLNQIQHTFPMPLMKISIKFIQIAMPQWASFTVSLSQTKAKVLESAVTTNETYNFVSDKHVVKIDPFKQIEESGMKRMAMLMKSLPVLKVDRMACKTETSERKGVFKQTLRAKEAKKVEETDFNNPEVKQDTPIQQNSKIDRLKQFFEKHEPPKTARVKPYKALDFHVHWDCEVDDSPKRKRPLMAGEKQVSSNIHNLGLPVEEISLTPNTSGDFY